MEVKIPSPCINFKAYLSIIIKYNNIESTLGFATKALQHIQFKKWSQVLDLL